MKKNKINKNYHIPREFPYYKLQYFNAEFVIWIDVQKAFQSYDELLKFARDKFSKTQKVRVMMIESERNRRLFSSILF